MFQIGWHRSSGSLGMMWQKCIRIIQVASISKMMRKLLCKRLVTICASVSWCRHSCYISDVGG